MPADTQEIMDLAEKIGQLLKEHPIVERYKQAQKAVAEDPEAGRLLAEFDRQLEQLARQEQTGRPVTDAQRVGLETLQSKIVSHLKIKNLNLAQVDFVDLLRKISQTYQKQLADTPAAAPGAPRVAGPLA